MSAKFWISKFLGRVGLSLKKSFTPSAKVLISLVSKLEEVFDWINVYETSKKPLLSKRLSTSSIVLIIIPLTTIAKPSIPVSKPEPIDISSKLNVLLYSSETTE